MLILLERSGSRFVSDFDTDSSGFGGYVFFFFLNVCMVMCTLSFFVRILILFGYSVVVLFPFGP